MHHKVIINEKTIYHSIHLYTKRDNFKTHKDTIMNHLTKGGGPTGSSRENDGEETERVLKSSNLPQIFHDTVREGVYKILMEKYFSDDSQ